MINNVCSAVLCVAWRLVLPVAALGVLVGSYRRGADSQAEPLTPQGQGRVALRDDERRTRIILTVLDADTSTPVVLQDRDGHDLLTVTLYRGGFFDFGTGSSVPLRVSGSTNAEGSMHLAVQHGFTRVDHHGSPGGGSMYTVVESFSGRAVASGSASAPTRTGP
jgi:hypothetical protein